MNAVVKPEKKLIKLLDVGCGPNKKADSVGVDIIDFPGVDVVHDLRKGPWPFEDNSVEMSSCSHFLEHLTNFNEKWERVLFFNELYRITVPGGKCDLVLPHWASQRYYGDPTHKEPFSEFSFYYLDKNWRAQQAPHTDIAHNPNGYTCHWNCQWGYSMHSDLLVRNQEYQTFAMRFWKEACQDMVVSMTATKD
jgi:SAM-dependent methyltransferase